VIPYILIRLIGIVLYVRVTTNLKGQNSAVLLFALLSITGLVAVFSGAFVSPSLRVYFWLAAIALDLLASFIAGRKDGWQLNSKHFAERHGLIVIIALGESLIVAASAISNSNDGRSTELLIVGALAVLVTCLLWWSYFSWIHENIDESFSKKSGSQQAMLARDAFSLMHFPLICGIIGIAIGFEKILQHPNEVLSIPVGSALGGGYLLYIGFTAISLWRSSKILLIPRIIILVISSVVFIFTIGYPSKYALSVIAISLLLMFIVEWKMCKHSENVQ
jgi:low temperature requirement protein LtrA